MIRPKLVPEPGASVPLYATLVTVAVSPLVVTEPFQAWLID